MLGVELAEALALDKTLEDADALRLADAFRVASFSEGSARVVSAMASN
jgi:hypothetical protein